MNCAEKILTTHTFVLILSNILSYYYINYYINYLIIILMC
jgi:hypothetical protein